MKIYCIKQYSMKN